MATALRPVGHEERLTLVGHLEELRTRLIICVVALAITCGLCYWQNGTVLDILNRPLESKEQADTGEITGDPLEQRARFNQLQQAQYASLAAFFESLPTEDLTAEQLRLRAKAIADMKAAAAAVPEDVASNPITLGVTEPFTQTLSVSFYAGLLLALPLLLYQLYAFLIPAFTPSERRVAVPIMLLVPILFLGGVAFGYFVVLERAIAFLQNFNDDNFDILVQARDYYKFCILFVGAIGLLFQIPVAVLAVTRTGILTPRQLRKNRGYAILAIAIVAAVATPTPDPITMSLSMIPLVVLYELSILLALWLDRVRPPVSRWDLDDEDELDDDDGDFSSFRQDASNGDASEDLTKVDGERRDRPEE
jgi:sec-independent protein translocase protein TatC